MISRKILFILALAFVLLTVQFASAATNMTACGTILSSGRWELNQSISGAGTCLTINSSNVEFDCNGYTISFNSAGGATTMGINVVYSTTALSNITIKDCIINDINASGATGNGIALSRVSNSYIFNNTIQTNGTSANYGIYLTIGCKNNIIENNTINALGTTTGNYGIYLLNMASNNTIIGNTVNATGTTTSYAIFVSTDSNDNEIKNNSLLSYQINLTGNTDGNTVYFSTSKNNNLSDNYIYSRGVSRNYAVYVTTNCDGTIIEDNSIIINATTTTNHGIYILYSPNLTIQRNNITIFGAGTLRGIYVVASDSAIIKDNFVTISNLTASTFDGIYISSSQSNLIQNNTIQLNGTSTLNGIYSLNSPTSYVKDNTLLMNGTTTLNGIFISSSLSNVVKNNTILINGTTTLNGIYSSSSMYNTIQDNFINVTGATITNNGIYVAYGISPNITNNTITVNGTTPIYGIYLIYSTLLGVVERNNVITSGTTANPAVYISTASNGNVIRNNTLLTRGSTTLNYGVQILSSNNNTIEYNYISTNGSTSNYGVYLSTHSESNSIRYNVIETNGTTTNYGIFFSSSSNNRILGNNISTNGTVRSGTTNNWGIHLAVNSENNEISNNTINTSGGGLNYGLSLITTSENNTYRWNKIYPGGNGVSNIGIYLAEANKNVFENNIISTSGTGTDYGVYLSSSSYGNSIKNNSISTLGSTTSHAFDFIYVATNNYPINNTLSYNNLLSIAGRDLNFETASINGTKLINQIIGNYSFTGFGGLVDVENTSAGNINFLPQINGTNTTFSSRIYIINNFARIDEYTRELNKSAEITLYNIPTSSTELQIIRNGVVCPAVICTNLTPLQAGNVTFNVTMGGNYSINSSSNVPALILNMPEDSFNTSIQNINFNFTATDDTSSILNCSIYIDSLINNTNSTTINNTLTNFLVEGIAEGNHSWYIQCFDGGYNVNISYEMTFNVSIPPSTVEINYPGNNSYINNVNYVLLNYTALDSDLRTMTVWLYGDEVLLNNSENIANGSVLTYNWTELSLGQHNWSIIVWNGIKNSSQEYSYFNVVNITMNIEAGGNYLENPIVLIQGAISDNSGLGLLDSQVINISIYSNSTSNLVASSNATTASNGIFNSIFTGLGVDNYTVDAIVYYKGITVNDSTSFIISLGYSAGYNVGIIDGNSTGYILGFNEGNITGFNLGNTTGFVFGNSTGFSLGNLTGFVFGNSTGYNSGYSIGNTTGFVLGNSTGYILGNATGFTIGNTTGFILGNQTGFIYGNISGFNLGNTTGFVYGNYTGFILGNISGFYFGNISGFNLGNTTGFNLGNAIGYILGLDTGNITGFNLGNTTGFVFGNNTGFSLGNLTGFYFGNQTGYSIGNTTGFVLGNSTGYILGNATGFTIGNTTGFILGNQTGFILGNVSGFNLGNSTGFVLGNNTGFILGNITGFYFGNSSGYNTGYNAGILAINHSSASLVLDKITSLQNITNETISYNITLRLTNKGGSNSTNVNITDLDYVSHNFTIGNLTAGETITRSYLINFTRNITTYSNAISIAHAYGIDSYLYGQILANSSSMNLPVPSNESGQQLTLIKNVFYINQTSINVNYTVSFEVINSGGSDLTGIAITDDDLGISDVISLSKTQSHSYSGSLIISKDQNNKEQTFSIARGTVNSVIYSSNQIKVLIPGYGGGPNDVSLNAPTSVLNNTNFNVVITVKNKNKDIGQDFILTYWLLSNDETSIYSTGAQTIYVGANDNTNSTTIVFLSPSINGTYKIRTNVSGTGVGVQATALSTILVTYSANETANETPVNPPSRGGSSKKKDITGEVIEEAACSAPYINSSEGCCLDFNNNSICDGNETSYEIIENETGWNATNNTNNITNNISNGASGEAPKGEGQFFNSIKNTINSVGKFFSSIGRKQLKSKNNLFIIFGIVILILLVIFVRYRILRKRRADILEQNLREGLELAGEGRIDEARDKYREIKNIYRSNEDKKKEIYSHISRFYEIINRIRD